MIIQLNNHSESQANLHAWANNVTAVSQATANGNSGDGPKYAFDFRRSRIDDLHVGATHYKFRGEQQLVLTFASDPQVRLRLESMSEIVGEGKNFERAKKDWGEKFHVAFQSLFQRHSSELTDCERATWDRICRIVDVDQYRKSRPFKIRKVGYLKDARNKHVTIKWRSGKEQRITFSQAPSEFAAYRPGQPFEAICLYDPVTSRFLRIETIFKKPASIEPNAKRIEEIISNARGPEDFAQTEWK